MPTEHILFYVHGMGHGQIDTEYPKLHGNIEAALKTSPGDFKIKAVPIQWDRVVARGQEALFRKAIADDMRRRNSSSLFGALLQKVVPFDAIRMWMMDYIGDVIAYTSVRDNGVEKGFLEPLRRAARESADFTYSLCAHSLGSVIAFDYVFNLFERDSFFAPDAKNVVQLEEEKADVRLLKQGFRGLFTFGSPIPLFMLRQSRLWEEDGDQPFAKVINPISKSQGCWVNFYDAEDVIAIPTRTLFPQVKDRYDEVLVQTGDDLLGKSHTGYWFNKEMAQRIAREIAAFAPRLD